MATQRAAWANVKVTFALRPNVKVTFAPRHETVVGGFVSDMLSVVVCLQS